MKTKPKHLLTALILCGGAGTRVDNQDKGLLDYQGKPLVSHLIETLQSAKCDIVISANRNIAVYQEFGYPVVSDDTLEAWQGPIAGILSAESLLIEKHVDNQSTNHLLVAPCDTPLLDQRFIDRMLDAIEPSKQVFAAHDGQRRQNLHCLIAFEALTNLRRFYESGGRAIREWQDQNQVIEVDFSDCANSFRNLNRLEEFS